MSVKRASASWLPVLLGLVVLTSPRAGQAQAAASAPGARTCEEIAAEIAAKIDASGVRRYELEIVPNALAAGEKAIGSCDNGRKKIIYVRAPAAAASAPRKP